MAQTWQGMKELIEKEKARQELYRRIVDYLLKAKEAKSADAIAEMFGTTRDELSKMAGLGLITYIPRNKYTVFAKAKRA